jgi:hypothetical protein
MDTPGTAKRKGASEDASAPKKRARTTARAEKKGQGTRVENIRLIDWRSMKFEAETGPCQVKAMAIQHGINQSKTAAKAMRASLEAGGAQSEAIQTWLKNHGKRPRDGARGGQVSTRRGM